ncbi:TPA: tail fiber assembly protein [Enterobacter asburiae]|nr:tail fiber assembly protein [Enterobacter asburiae]HCA3849528.1 tail fiber assembly protein [Enterobacter asburiae]HDS9624462.1 tail fiber assembly protein [Enterobacter asburiae]HDT1961181.1 tail fiber assembly protein [Enterobacter asburiae]
MQIFNKEGKIYTISGTRNYAWSATQNTFYLIADLLAYIRNNNWPDDATEVSDEIFAEFSAFQKGDGKIRGTGADGMPAWVAPPEPSKDDLIRNAENQRSTLMAKASLEIEMLSDAESDGSISDDEKELLAKWKAYRLALRRLDLSSAPDIIWPPVPE